MDKKQLEIYYEARLHIEEIKKELELMFCYYQLYNAIHNIPDEDSMKDWVSNNCGIDEIYSDGEIVDYVQNNINIDDVYNVDDVLEYVRDSSTYIGDIYNIDDILDYIRDNYCIEDIVEWRY